MAGVWEAAEKIGYPLIVKPIAGAGSADTYRVDSSADLGDVLPRLRHVPEVSVEEFVEAEEFTYDTVCAGGQILFDHILWYRPRPLQMAQHEWVSPVAISLRELDVPHLQGGRQMGEQVLAALGFDTGFTHMEWYRKADGEVVFGEIGARPPGVRVVDMMNFSTDGDVYVGWAEAVVHGRMRPHGEAVQRREHLQASTRIRSDLLGDRAGRALVRVRRLGARGRPAAGRRAPPGLAGIDHR